MPIEMIILGATIILALVHIGLAAQARTNQYGPDWNLGPRDEEMPPLNPIAGRLVRAQTNLFETLPLFIGALLACAVTNRLGTLTEIGAALYFTGRLIFLPLYAAGVKGWRTAVFVVALIGLILIVSALMVG
jgi:uncharacterized MAPEG superfamily protein